MKTKTSKQARIGFVLMLLGAVLVLGAVTLVLYNRWEDQQAGAAASSAVTALEKQLPAKQNGAVTRTGANAVNEKDKGMAALEVQGRSYIGLVQLPSLGLELPVLSSWSYANLREAPCRYQGTATDGSLIIAGHNYQSHFGRLHTLHLGDAVSFTDMTGHVYRYNVSSMETIPTADSDRMKSGNWDLTLFTCTLDGQQRVTVRCTLQKDKEGT